MQQLRAAHIAKLFADAGLITIASFISLYSQERELARSLLQKGRFIEVFVNCPLEIAENRDPRGLYKLARAGKIKGFTGIDAPYEVPKAPELELRSDLKSPE